MALVPRKALCKVSSILFQFKRFRGKINIQRPRAPHFDRAAYIALTKPYFVNPNKDKPPTELCQGFITEKSNEIENPFQRLLAKDLYKRLETSRLVAFYHLNPMSADERFRAFHLFKKQKMHFQQYGKKTLSMAVEGTPYEAVLGFYVSHNMTVFSPEPEIKTLFKVSKKFPQLVLLAGIVDGKFVSKDELLALSLIPNIQAAQASLVQTLNSAASQLVSHLNSHQTTLVSHIEERLKQLEEEEGK